jgi:hypothetical protein
LDHLFEGILWKKKRSLNQTALPAMICLTTQLGQAPMRGQSKIMTSHNDNFSKREVRANGYPFA